MHMDECLNVAYEQMANYLIGNDHLFACFCNGDSIGGARILKYFLSQPSLDEKIGRADIFFRGSNPRVTVFDLSLSRERFEQFVESTKRMTELLQQTEGKGLEMYVTHGEKGDIGYIVSSR